MLSLPNELLLDIFELVTHVPGLLDVHPSPNKVFFPEKENIDDLIEEFFQTLPTRRSLPLVSRAFNAVATPLLYACIVLSPLSTFRLSGSLDDKKGSLVRHIIMDFPGHDWNRPERDLVRIFAHFSAVRVLSVRSRSTSQFWFRRQLGGAPLLRAMRMALCPTLRKLVLQEHALSLFTHRHLSKFTSCLVHLEALVALNLKPSQMRIPFPKSLPRLSYVDIQSAPFNLPANITPTHVRTFSDPLSTPLTGVLTHLSLSITNTTSLTAYASLSIACPALDSLTLSGPLPRITHVLVNYLLPAVRNLAFTDLAISVMGGLLNIHTQVIREYRTAEHLQAWVDALMEAGNRQTTVCLVRILDSGLAEALCDMVGAGVVRVDALEECEFMVEGEDGRALLNGDRRSSSMSP